MSTNHRVVEAPADQRGLTFLRAYYSAMAEEGVETVGSKESPALQRVRIDGECDDAVALTMGKYRCVRVMAYGSKARTKKGDASEEQDINGNILKDYLK